MPGKSCEPDHVSRTIFIFPGVHGHFLYLAYSQLVYINPSFGKSQGYLSVGQLPGGKPLNMRPHDPETYPRDFAHETSPDPFR